MAKDKNKEGTEEGEIKKKKWVREKMKARWEGKLIEAVPKAINEDDYRLRIARIAEILYNEYSQLSIDQKKSASIAPKIIQANSDQVA